MSASTLRLPQEHVAHAPAREATSRKTPASPATNAVVWHSDRLSAADIARVNATIETIAAFTGIAIPEVHACATVARKNVRMAIRASIEAGLDAPMSNKDIRALAARIVRG